METAAAKVTIYSLPGCMRCRRLTTFLAQQAVPFTEVSVLTQPRALTRIEFGYQYQPALPLVVLDGRVFQAPTPRRLAAALRLTPARRVSPAGRRPARGASTRVPA